MEQRMMKEKPVFPLMVSMSLPMVFSMMINALYNIVDSYFVSKISEDAMAALSLVFPMQNFINAVAIGFGVGMNAVIAFYLGAKDEQRANDACVHGILLNAIHGLMMTIIFIALLPHFLGMFTDNQNVIELGLRYANIVFLFAVVITVELCFEKIFQAIGRMNVAMMGVLCGSLVNIILDPILIFGLGPVPQLGIEGAAIATGIGQVVTLVYYFIVYFSKPCAVQLHFKSMKLQKGLTRRLYALGIPATLNLALPSLLVSSLNAILASFSEMYVVVLGVYYKLQTFIYLTANGIVQGMRPLISYNAGAREEKRVKKIYLTALLMNASIMLLGTILCLLIPEQLIGLFTSNAVTIGEGSYALRIISMGFVVSAVSVTSTGALEGLGKGTPSLFISLLRYVLVIIPCAFLLSQITGATGVWHAFWISELITAVLAYLIYRNATK